MSEPVLILGGGIGGLALSIDLKKRGHTVILIEKGIYPRHKVCGEYISMESYDYLSRICPALSGFSFPFINRFKLTTPNAAAFTTALEPGGFGLSRFLLEETLYQEAEGQGVVVLLNTRAEKMETSLSGQQTVYLSGGKELKSSIVCNASGRKSNLETREQSVQTGHRNYVGVKYHIRMDRDPEQIEIHNFPGGYCGISSVENGMSCLCYMSNASQLKRAGNSIPELEKQFLFQNPDLKTIFKNASFLYPEPLTISGINFRIKRSHADGVFFLGDSAGSIAPITGNGMSMALRSASALASLLDLHLSGKLERKALDIAYDQFWEANFSKRIRLSRHFQKLSEFPALSRMTIGLFNLFPSIAKTTISKTHGERF